MSTDYNDLSEFGKKIRDDFREAMEADKTWILEGAGMKPMESDLPFDTMFKLWGSVETRMSDVSMERMVECVSCGKILELKTFLDNQGIMERECPSCKVTAPEYWRDNPHRKVMNVKGT